MFAVLGYIVKAAELELQVVFREGNELRMDISEHHLVLSQLEHAEQEVTDDMLAGQLHFLSVTDDFTEPQRMDTELDAGIHAPPLELQEVRKEHRTFHLGIHGGPKNSFCGSWDVFLIIAL